MEKVRYGGTFIGLLRDHGHGRVDDRRERPGRRLLRPHRRARRRATRTGRSRRRPACTRAAGAREIQPLAAGTHALARAATTSTRCIARWQRVPLRAGGFRLFCAHQMGTCRMGKDPQTSVADPWGELHDTKGVWIGDGSAFPTASGTNPMITIMALAHRTAEAIAAEQSASTGKAAAASQSPRPDRSPHGSSRRDFRYATSSTSAASGSSPPAARRSTSSTPRPRRSWAAIPQGTPEDVDRAVAAARAAFEAWSQTPLVERAELVRAIAAGLAGAQRGDRRARSRRSSACRSGCRRRSRPACRP